MGRATERGMLSAMANTGARARPGFPDTADLYDPSGAIGVWFTSPPGALIQFVSPAYSTVELGRWLAGPGRQRLEAKFPSGPIFLVFDLGLMTGRDPAIRPVLLEAAAQMKARVSCAFVPPIDTSPVYLASLKAVAALAAVVGVRVDIHRSLSFALASRGVTHARRD